MWWVEWTRCWWPWRSSCCNNMLNQLCISTMSWDEMNWLQTSTVKFVLVLHSHASTPTEQDVTQLSGQSDELRSMTLFVLHGQAATGYCDTGSIALQSIVDIKIHREHWTSDSNVAARVFKANLFDNSWQHNDHIWMLRQALCTTVLSTVVHNCTIQMAACLMLFPWHADKGGSVFVVMCPSDLLLNWHSSDVDGRYFPTDSTQLVS